MKFLDIWLEKFLILVGVLAGYDDERIVYIHVRYLLVIAALICLMW
jgi:hypothetical protein